ncbi:TVG0108190 [Thermoplasma volcanium GSS1]|uniref:TVG0108190 protein n=1 Tax=Thermoplasma volcanium (strain ATCC 51530 / DSM 4299 / JCM 9571 / NBRC 15438 / GSS1) TaxID=273116 RepID=Q97CJ8_THEVO|nr:DUF3834 domain-containing protein [Thermoplasma volcanium]BAB59245.1 TVG0108190 [Thermoplasma volcanium GSS1]
MDVGMPFAGPVSFPLLVIEEELPFRIHNICSETGKFDVVLDSITNMPKYGLKIFAGVRIDMYSILGDESSGRIYTLRKGTLADFNARILAYYDKAQVINADGDTCIKMANEGYSALVGNEISIGKSFRNRMKELGLDLPSCAMASTRRIDEVIEAYEQGIDFIKNNHERAAEIISKKSGYYSEEVMKKIIGIYGHEVTKKRAELVGSRELYSRVVPELNDIEIIG